MKGCISASVGEMRFLGDLSSMPYRKSMSSSSFSQPYESYFLMQAARSLSAVFCLPMILALTRPCTPNMPKLTTLLPLRVVILPLRPSHSGNPVMISRKIAPSDQMSKLQGSILLKSLRAPSWPDACRLSMKLSTSGDRYSGVLMLMLVASEYTKADPKSMILRSVICSPSNLTRMLSGLRSACTMSSAASSSNTCSMRVMKSTSTARSLLSAK
mmetsp:Transcript_2424/g.3143  ORF Transcript_2424/g.3143 Transcript_2424/m.3143 type:complete len:214 (-) Transcript_2424:889-1530(-)